MELETVVGLDRGLNDTECESHVATYGGVSIPGTKEPRMLAMKRLTSSSSSIGCVVLSVSFGSY
jgi:hypothetical protein